MDSTSTRSSQARAQFHSILLDLCSDSPVVSHRALDQFSSWLNRHVKHLLLAKYRVSLIARADLYDDVLQESLYRIAKKFMQPKVDPPAYPVAYCFRVMHNVYVDMHRKLAGDAMGYAHPQELDAADDSYMEKLVSDHGAAEDDTYHRQALLHAASVLGPRNLSALLKHDHGMWVQFAGRSQPRYGSWTQTSGEYRFEVWDILDVLRWRRDAGEMGEVKDEIKSARSWLSDLRKKLFLLLQE